MARIYDAYHVHRYDRIADKEVIDQLHDLYDKHPEAWVKGVAAVNSKGKPVSALDADVCRVCLSAGLTRLSRSNAQATRLSGLVSSLLPGKHKVSQNIPGFNDSTKTTVDDVKAVLKTVSTHIRFLNGD